jgi:uncharacterized protein (TIGR02453 family)
MFSEAALDFLRKLKRNNKREWFTPRKEIFERELKAPMEKLVEEINGALLDFAPDYVTEPKRALFRIYRDTRFSNDKTPYKTHVAAWFRRTGVKDTSAAGFYFHVSPDGVAIAGGVYQPTPEQLAAIRNHLAEHHERFRDLAAAKALTKLAEFEGETLSRVPKGFAKDHPAEDLLRAKRWGWHASHPPELATSPKLRVEIVKSFKTLAPVVSFLNEAFEAKRRRAVFFD